MPLIKCSAQQLESAQRLYEAATHLIERSIVSTMSGVRMVDDASWEKFTSSVDRCKEEFEKHG